MPGQSLPTQRGSRRMIRGDTAELSHTPGGAVRARTRSHVTRHKEVAAMSRYCLRQDWLLISQVGVVGRREGLHEPGEHWLEAPLAIVHMPAPQFCVKLRSQTGQLCSWTRPGPSLQLRLQVSDGFDLQLCGWGATLPPGARIISASSPRPDTSASPGTESWTGCAPTAPRHQSIGTGVVAPFGGARLQEITHKAPKQSSNSRTQVVP